MEDDLQLQEVQEMFEFQTGVKVEETPREETQTEQQTEQETQTEQEQIGELETKTETTEEQKEETTEQTLSVEDELRAEIARLSSLVTAGKLTEGTEQVYPEKQTDGQKEEVKPQTKVDPNEALKALLTGELLTQDELDAVIDKPELLNAAYKRANEQLVQNLFGALPTIVNQYVQREIQVNKLVTTFYEMYSDLRPYADFVKLNMAEIEKAKPQATYEEIFKETATQCRKRLGLKEQSGTNPDGKPKKDLPAAFAGSKTNSSKTPLAKGKSDFFDANAADMFEL